MGRASAVHSQPRSGLGSSWLCGQSFKTLLVVPAAVGQRSHGYGSTRIRPSKAPGNFHRMNLCSGTSPTEEGWSVVEPVLLRIFARAADAESASKKRGPRGVPATAGEGFWSQKTPRRRHRLWAGCTWPGCQSSGRSTTSFRLWWPAEINNSTSRSGFEARSH